MVTRLIALLALTSGCTLIRDLGYLGEGEEQPLPDLCPGGGWCPLPDTKLEPQCPDDNVEHNYNYTCKDVIRINNGGVYDSAHSRLIIWGAGAGGTNHFGNEVYALSLIDGTMRRLTDPSSSPECVSQLPDGTPHPRVTRDSLAAVNGTMMAVGGESACGFFDDTWRFDIETIAWTNLAPTGPVGCDPMATGSCGPGDLGIMLDYDPVSDAVFVKDGYNFWRYDGAANSYEKLRDDVFTSYAMTGRVDPDRRLFVYIGCSIVSTMCVPTLGAISIDPEKLYSNSDWTMEQSGCEPLMGVGGPGFTYDARQKVFVGWPNEGDTVYLLNPDTKTCTPQSAANGPPAADHDGGTFGRFRYMPEFDAFIVVNDFDIDAYVLRL